EIDRSIGRKEVVKGSGCNGSCWSELLVESGGNSEEFDTDFANSSGHKHYGRPSSRGLLAACSNSASWTRRNHLPGCRSVFTKFEEEEIAKSIVDSFKSGESVGLTEIRRSLLMYAGYIGKLKHFNKKKTKMVNREWLKNFVRRNPIMYEITAVSTLMAACKNVRDNTAVESSSTSTSDMSVVSEFTSDYSVPNLEENEEIDVETCEEFPQDGTESINAEESTRLSTQDGMKVLPVFEHDPGYSGHKTEKVNEKNDLTPGLHSYCGVCGVDYYSETNRTKDSWIRCKECIIIYHKNCVDAKSGMEFVCYICVRLKTR
ncbi:hypothetical protein C0J52_10681, partial [Blattella germanica]